MDQKTSEYPDVDLGIVESFGGWFDFSQVTAIIISPPSIIKESRKFEYSDLKSLFLNSVTNIYNSDGTLAANRTVEMDGKWLSFQNGFTGFEAAVPAAIVHIEGNNDTPFRIDTAFGDNTFNVYANGKIVSLANEIDLAATNDVRVKSGVSWIEVGTYGPGSYQWSSDSGGGNETYFYGDPDGFSFSGQGGNVIVESNSSNLAVGASSGVLNIFGGSAIKLSFGGMAADRALYVDSSQDLKTSSVTSTELGYLSGASSPLQAQIDALSSGLDWKQHVRFATATGENIDIATGGLSQTIDGALRSLNTDDRILLQFQTSATENGIYLAKSGSWVRSSDANTGAELVQATVGVSEGSDNSDKKFTCTNDTITIGVTSITWVQVGGTTYVGTTNRITVTGNVIDIAATYIGQSSITTLGTVTTGTWNATVIAKAYLPAATVYTDQANTYTAGMKQIFQADATNAGLRFGGVTANPSSPTGGDMWYRSDDGFMRYYDSNASTVRTLVNLAGTQILSNKSIDLSTNTITGTAAQFNTACSDNDFVFTNDSRLVTDVTSYTASPSGWSSLTINQAYYIKSGKQVTVYFEFLGTSNSTAASFLLPFTPNSIYGTSTNAMIIPVHIQNGGTTGFGRIDIDNTTTVNAYSASGATAWGSSGNKYIRGTIVYYANS